MTFHLFLFHGKYGNGKTLTILITHTLGSLRNQTKLLAAGMTKSPDIKMEAEQSSNLFMRL